MKARTPGSCVSEHKQSNAALSECATYLPWEDFLPTPAELRTLQRWAVLFLHHKGSVVLITYFANQGKWHSPSSYVASDTHIKGATASPSQRELKDIAKLSGEVLW